MERVVIIGPGGAGKSELARSIARRTGLPVVHLDLLFWREGWTPAPRKDALGRLDKAIAGDRWILDGNFLEAGGEDRRFNRADTVIFLDLPRRTCLWRVLACPKSRPAPLPAANRRDPASSVAPLCSA